MDFRLAFDNSTGTADLVLTANGDLAIDDGLETAILISLGSDAMARADDEIPDNTADRRGWWADFITDAGVLRDETGSRLWLLDRADITPDTLRLAEQYAAESLAWLVEDGVAESVAVEARGMGRNGIGLGVLLNRGTARESRFDYLWNNEGLPG